MCLTAKGGSRYGIVSGRTKIKSFHEKGAVAVILQSQISAAWGHTHVHVCIQTMEASHQP